MRKFFKRMPSSGSSSKPFSDIIDGGYGHENENNKTTPWGLGDRHYPIRYELLSNLFLRWGTFADAMDAVQKYSLKIVMEQASFKFWTFLSQMWSALYGFEVTEAISTTMKSIHRVREFMLQTISKPFQSPTCVDKHPGLCAHAHKEILADVKRLVEHQDRAVRDILQNLPKKHKNSAERFTALFVWSTIPGSGSRFSLIFQQIGGLCKPYVQASMYRVANSWVNGQGSGINYISLAIDPAVLSNARCMFLAL